MFDCLERKHIENSWWDYVHICLLKVIHAVASRAFLIFSGHVPWRGIIKTKCFYRRHCFCPTVLFCSNKAHQGNFNWAIFFFLFCISHRWKLCWFFDAIHDARLATFCLWYLSKNTIDVWTNNVQMYHSRVFWVYRLRIFFPGVNECATLLCYLLCEDVYTICGVAWIRVMWCSLRFRLAHEALCSYSRDFCCYVMVY